jgi:hypothetical protein
MVMQVTRAPDMQDVPQENTVREVANGNVLQELLVDSHHYALLVTIGHPRL